MGCQCCDRRYFLKSLLSGAFAFTVLQPTQPARAEEREAKALVLSCIDFRFLGSERYFLSLQNLGNQYDWTALAGASLALAGFPSGADTQAFWDQLDLSYKLHHIKKVIILDHQDCGAYAIKFDPELNQDAERELQVHTDYLNQAFWAIRKRYPDLNIELYFVNSNAEVKPILPITQTAKTTRTT
ncbi:carbonic anhydrase [Kamptonema animale CS-326]|uniref:carbonic anhydrase n=1 Tax=Kamptonema animale TaxID=92934 RepID=UPI0023310F97|nr:carbonic anhydrase [Kamptonema animale]MDB9511348.1 carbonic anhydrase [Kamptonema animale CS-326]